MKTLFPGIRSAPHQATNISSFIFDVRWVRHVVGAVTHQLCRQALVKKAKRCVAAQRLVGYAKNANPPYI